MRNEILSYRSLTHNMFSSVPVPSTYTFSNTFAKRLHDERGQKATEIHDQWDCCDKVLQERRVLK